MQTTKKETELIKTREKEEIEDFTEIQNDILRIIKIMTKKSGYKKGLLQNKLFSAVHSISGDYTGEKIMEALKSLVKDDDIWDIEIQTLDALKEIKKLEKYEGNENKIEELRKKVIPIIQIGNPKESHAYMKKYPAAWGSRYWYLGKMHHEND